MIRVNNLHVPLDKADQLTEILAQRLGLTPQEILKLQVVRKALDARRYKGAPLHWVYLLQVQVSTANARRLLRRWQHDRDISEVEAENLPPIPFLGKIGKHRPVVVGFGPAGIFTALTLARAGLCPLVLERGASVEQRHQDVMRFWQQGKLLPHSNVQFGEGGAGTFSDGKLTTRLHDAHIQGILADFVQAGAPAEIRILQKPHIGTDRLRTVVKNLREEIKRLGGTVRFNSQVTDMESQDGRLRALIVNDVERIEADAVFLGIGHSARDTYTLLARRGVYLEPKAFAIGVRIEHPQAFINEAQYGADATSPYLDAADYALTHKATGRGVYSFCMCPGGKVIAAASELQTVVTNGMSDYRRDSGIANAALLVTVSPSDFLPMGRQNPLAGMYFQRELEHRAFLAGGGDYRAPVQAVGDFLAGTSGAQDFLFRPTYLPGTHPADFTRILPNFVVRALQEGLIAFDHKIKGFAADDIPLTGVESRSSAPCRIVRDKVTYQSQSLAGLYPTGEGAGYAGGIMSAAVDGRKAALAYIQSFQ